MRKIASTNTVNKEQLEKDCDIAYAGAVVSGRWKLSILTFLLDQERIRYRDLKNLLPGISENVLITQLKKLEADGVIRKILYAEVPPRVEYLLTPKGLAMKPVLQAMWEWGKQYRENKI